ncbi:hypothetical protein AHAS_Ahas19G0247800 [Arachis hypogaea]
MAPSSPSILAPCPPWLLLLLNSSSSSSKPTRSPPSTPGSKPLPSAASPMTTMSP